MGFLAINRHILYDNLYDDSAINKHILLFDYVWQLWYVCFWVILTVALNVECGRRLKESICGATRSHAANSFLNAHCQLTAQNPPTCCNGQFWQGWSFTCLTGGNYNLLVQIKLFISGKVSLRRIWRIEWIWGDQKSLAGLHDKSNGCWEDVFFPRRIHTVVKTSRKIASERLRLIRDSPRLIGD